MSLDLLKELDLNVYSYVYRVGFEVLLTCLQRNRCSSDAITSLVLNVY